MSKRASSALRMGASTGYPALIRVVVFQPGHAGVNGASASPAVEPGVRGDQEWNSCC